MMRLQVPDFVVEIDGLVEVDEQGRRWLPDVDDEIAPAVLALWAAGIPTRYSCSGHGGDTGVVMVAVPGGDPERWLCVMTASQMAELHDGCQSELAAVTAERDALRRVVDALDRYQSSVERAKCGESVSDMRVVWAEVRSEADNLRAALAARGGGDDGGQGG